MNARPRVLLTLRARAGAAQLSGRRHRFSPVVDLDAVRAAAGGAPLDKAEEEAKARATKDLIHTLEHVMSSRRQQAAYSPLSLGSP